MCVSSALAQPSTATAREFPPGSLTRIDQLPPGRFRAHIEQLPPAAQERATQWLRSFHFTEGDLDSLRADTDGGIFYVCDLVKEAATEPDNSQSDPVTSEAAVPVSPFPSSLIFHSRPGAPNVLYLNFCGEDVSNTQWNVSEGRSVFNAVAFSTDSDFSTFSDSEQAAIKRVWQRVAEDFAPFNIDVTTERPATFNTRTAHALITRNTDANGLDNPASSAGGVAYVNVFASSSYANYRPAWVYYNNLANNESYIAEAASHEIGHNLGLSHDGKTDGSAYYNGHGSGDTSWGPLMGTGYNRNLSQWCKGEYYLANNTQDDLAIIAGKITYRTDDHGGTHGTATALITSGGTNILSTTPESDPFNTNAVNKGVLERNNDVDVFSFITGSGAVSLSVKPWIQPAGTRGGNLDVLLELRDFGGALVTTNNASSLTTAAIQTNLPSGQYYLHVKNAGTGSPLNSSPSGYTAYGSIGQYFISGFVTYATNVVVPPLAQLATSDITEPGQGAKQLAVTYTDNLAIETSTIDTNDLRVVGPNGYDRFAQSVSVNASGNGTPRIATYSFAPPNGVEWLPADDGLYTVFMRSNQVADIEEAWVGAGELGQFNVAVPVAVYAAKLDANPGWTLDPQWAYGTPNYSGGGPAGGFTGTKIIGYNLSGNYANNLSPKYATTPEINASGSTSLTLRFKRWLGLKNRDDATIEASADGVNWAPVWSTSSPVSDNGWVEVQYALPTSVVGSSTLRLRWGIASGQSQNDIGWNIDDILILADGVLDTAPPLPSLNVSDLTTEGSPSHSCSITYTDASGVRLASLDSSDVLVTGPGGYSNLLEFIGADLPMDGSPLTASYAIPAPGGDWDAGDNGAYVLTLLEGQVEDALNNAMPQTVLGGFNVTIPTNAPGLLLVTPTNGFAASGYFGGPFNPSNQVYTLTNAGESPLNWQIAIQGGWLAPSANAGTLAPASSTNVTISLSPGATQLSAGEYQADVEFDDVGTGVTDFAFGFSISVKPPDFTLSLAANNPAWGSVSPTNGSYAAGTVLQLQATPAPYYQFNEWTGDVLGATNPVEITLNTNLTATAVFAEMLTTNHPTPHWWLAAQGYTNDFENAVSSVGANGMPLWQSYVAGLDPNDPASQLAITATPASDGVNLVLGWNTVTGRVYSLWSGEDVLENFAPIPAATNLPWTVQSFTNAIDPSAPGQFFRLEVRKP